MAEKTEAVVTATPEENAVQKQLQDLANKSSRSMVAVIDAMTQRGAFKGEELSTIGGLRDQCIQKIYQKILKVKKLEFQKNIELTICLRK